MTLHTRLAELVEIEHPIISALMAFTAGSKLAAAVTAAGGLGIIGGDYGDADWLERELDEAGNARVGCGFITCGGRISVRNGRLQPKAFDAK